jgi:hypothetical protein
VVVSVQGSARRYLLIASGLLLRAAASIRICRKNSWHHAVTGIHPCEHSLPSQKAAWSTTLTVKQTLVCLPVPTKGFARRTGPEVTESLRSRSDSCRLLASGGHRVHAA